MSRFVAAAMASALLALAPLSVAMAATACPEAGFVVVEARASPATRPVHDGPRHILSVQRTPLTRTADITEIKLAGDAYDTLVQLRFTPEAARRLHEATTNRSGMRIAFVVGDRTISAVTWEGPYGMDADLGVQMSLGRAVPQVRPLVEAVRKCIGPAARQGPPAPSAPAR